MLESRAIVLRTRPELSGEALYEQVLAHHCGVDAPTARRMLGRTASSLIDWQSDRDLRLRDVVWYVAVESYLRAHPGSPGTHTSMADAVAEIIGRDL